MNDLPVLEPSSWQKKNKIKENFMVILCYLLGTVLGYCNSRAHSYMYITSKKLNFASAAYSLVDQIRNSSSQEVQD